ncbi:DUF397 domain-containing protein [Streptomyces sp. NBC_00893]|uniref:DUF397 domain-containing protein n=1 Tax=Streptomyces sp. NBC_00893 TaxID=2975862 RepID=UPI00224FB87D|nr:DUF397 domain-containing protein [Streptomyces sp. NBC_00893]MCX4845464.1 DUF397 domain-containing protein [Streptomyces sp. NBC_00893]
MKRNEPIVPDASVLPGWRKSSYSGGSSGDCLEVSEAYASWRKSSYSGGTSGDCLEVNDSCTACVPVRDSKNPHGPAVVFGASAWMPFVTAVKGDRLV